MSNRAEAAGEHKVRARLNSYRHTAPAVPPCGPSSSSSRQSPPGGIVALMSFNVIVSTLGLALGLVGALLIVDALGWRAVAGMFDRERLVTGSRG